jgi:Na+/H+ antiporter NhaA
MTDEQVTVSGMVTPWRRDTALRRFLSTETGSAMVLLVAAVVALVWVNADHSSYSTVWGTRLTVRLGAWVVSMNVRAWVNSGLMTFFFLVVGLEARREFDVGELRERRRIVLPLLAGVGGMAVAVGVYLAINAGHSSAHGWGVAMSTDTAFALGALAVVGRRAPDRLRGFILTVVVIDDIVGLVVIATVYSRGISLRPLMVALALFAIILAAMRFGIQRGLLYLVLGTACWIALFKSGVDPIVVGLVIGLVVYATPAARSDLERATDLFRVFREQPTPELARSASAGVAAAISPNERLQQRLHPWTSYVFVPVFALANAGIVIDPAFLSHAYRSPVTLGIVVGYVVGKPLGVFGTAWLGTSTSQGRLRPPVGWAAVLGGGTIAGIPFTVSILIATLAFRGAELEEAKLGILTAALAATVLTWLVFQVVERLPRAVRARALLGTSEVIVDLADAVDSARDHQRGPDEAPVTLVEYGDFECPYCGQAEPTIRTLLADHGDLRYVWRHLPLRDVHHHAQLAAEASEAAAEQGAFWQMHDLLLGHQDALQPRDLTGYATQLGLDVDRFAAALRAHAYRARVEADIDSADLSGVTGTPTFFVNGRRHYGAYDVDALSQAVRAAKARSTVAAARPP